MRMRQTRSAAVHITLRWMAVIPAAVALVGSSGCGKDERASRAPIPTPAPPTGAVTARQQQFQAERSAGAAADAQRRAAGMAAVRPSK